MFLRKLFSSDNKLTWVLVDLLIVIVGVYLAFMIQSGAEHRKDQREADKVLTALKYEMEFFRYRMYETSLGMQSMARELKESNEDGSYRNFSNFRFIEPQYDYQTISYALDLQNTSIVDFELYDALQTLFVEIKKIEHVERLLTETSRRYRSIPFALDAKSTEFQIIEMENRDNFNRFQTLINDRAEISARISKASASSLPLINQRLGTVKTRSIEKAIMREHLDIFENEEEAIAVGKKLFPHFEEKELLELYRGAKNAN